MPSRPLSVMFTMSSGGDYVNTYSMNQPSIRRLTFCASSRRIIELPWQDFYARRHLRDSWPATTVQSPRARKRRKLPRTSWRRKDSTFPSWQLLSYNPIALVIVVVPFTTQTALGLQFLGNIFNPGNRKYSGFQKGYLACRSGRNVYPHYVGRCTTHPMLLSRVRHLPKRDDRFGKRL